VKWRNVGIYKLEGKIKAVVFDLTGLVEVGEEDVNWITDALESLEESIVKSDSFY
jgi:hypothetical protein